MSPFARHEVEWTPEKIGRFWDYLAENASKETAYFSFVLGNLVIRAAERSARLDEPVLDFGCGPGFLAEKLLSRGYAVSALDYSPESVRVAADRCARHPKFGGAIVAKSYPSSVPDGSVGTVFLVEAIEHLLPEDRAGVLEEIRRVLRPGGIVVVTTPNSEDLLRGKLMCPDCGCVFHTIQHVSSWTADGLTRTMAEHGFAVVACESHVFKRGDWANALFRLFYAATGRPRPNLVYVGRKA